MTRKPYKDYEKVEFGMPGRPDVLKMVDTVHGVVYINTCAAEDAKIIMYMTEYSSTFSHA